MRILFTLKIIQKTIFKFQPTHDDYEKYIVQINIISAMPTIYIFDGTRNR